MTRWTLPAVVLSTAIAGPLPPQEIAPEGERLTELLEEARGCHGVASGGTERSVCATFVARALFALHGIVDFGPRSGRFLSSPEIDAELPETEEWRRAGTADDAAALERACEAVARQRPALAARDGFVAVLLPAPCVATGWGDRVPLAAAYFGGRPLEASFAGSPLSWVFRAADRDRVTLWVREVGGEREVRPRRPSEGRPGTTASAYSRPGGAAGSNRFSSPI